MKDKLITIIVPIYNVEKYLAQCIESIISQTYKKIEIILVNDGSSDSSGKICEHYANIDNRIKIINKKNGGLSSARNIAMQKCSGKYIMFVDGDDIISEKTIELLYQNIINNSSDISTCKMVPFYDDDLTITKKIQKNHKIRNHCRTLNTEQSLKMLLYHKMITNSANAKLYSKKLFEKIKYPEGEICEDLATTYKIFSSAKRVSFNSNIMYFYRQRKHSIMHTKNEKRLSALDFAKEETRFVTSKYPKLKNAATYREFMESVFLLKAGYQSKEIINTYKKYRYSTMLNPKTSIKMKIYALVGANNLKKLTR